MTCFGIDVGEAISDDLWRSRMCDNLTERKMRGVILKKPVHFRRNRPLIAKMGLLIPG